MEQHIDILSNIPMLAGLPEDKQLELFGRAKTRHIEKNTIIVSEGDESTSLFILLSGSVRVYRNDEEGRQIIINNLGSGDYFGELALLSDEPRSANVMTREPSKMLVINKSDFLSTLESDFSIAMSVIKDLVSRVQTLTDDLSSLALHDVYNRLVRYIMEHSVETEGKMLTHKATHQEIADTIGSSREMVSRILADLKTGGYIDYESQQITLIKKLPPDW